MYSHQAIRRTDFTSLYMETCKERVEGNSFLRKNVSKISPLLHPSILSLARSIPKDMPEDRVVAQILQGIIEVDGKSEPQLTGGSVARMRHAHSQFLEMCWNSP